MLDDHHVDLIRSDISSKRNRGHLWTDNDWTIFSVVSVGTKRYLAQTVADIYLPRYLRSTCTQGKPPAINESFQFTQDTKKLTPRKRTDLIDHIKTSDEEMKKVGGAKQKSPKGKVRGGDACDDLIG
jgi:hypothetical protein